MLESSAQGIVPGSFARCLIATLAASTMILVTGCQRQENSAPNLSYRQAQNDPGRSPELPVKVLSITALLTSPFTGGRDISRDDPASLRRLASNYAAKGAFRDAAQYQYWVVQPTDDGRYDLAC